MARAGNAERQVRALVASLRRETAMDTHAEALAAVAVILARQLDAGDNQLMTPSLSRELRLTMAELTEKVTAVGGDDDDWLRDLRAPVRDEEAP